MKIAGIETDDCINGEGISVSLWMQGCPLHCKGCQNPETWDFEGGTDIDFQDLISQLRKLITKNGIQRNFSILGGEPLATNNIQLTMDIVCLIRRTYPNIKIFIWTGYEFSELIRKYSLTKLKGLFEDINVLITGRYKEELRDITQKWIGSTNQKILYKGIDF